MQNLNKGLENTALYKMVQIQHSSKKIKFQSTSLDSALGYMQWYVRRYRTGLLLEVSKVKKSYDYRTKIMRYEYE